MGGGRLLTLRTAVLALAGLCFLGAILFNLSRPDDQPDRAPQPAPEKEADTPYNPGELGDTILPPLEPGALEVDDGNGGKNVEEIRRALYEDILHLRARAAREARGPSPDAESSGGAPVGSALPKRALKQAAMERALANKYLGKLAARHQLTFEKLLEVEEEGQSKGWTEGWTGPARN